jgi:hypothetical protein
MTFASETSLDGLVTGSPPVSIMTREVESERAVWDGRPDAEPGLETHERTRHPRDRSLG